MSYLLDTDTIVYHLRGKVAIGPEIYQEGFSISVITLGELLYGAKKSVDEKKSLSVLDDFLKGTSTTVLAVDERVILEFAQIKALLEKDGKRLEDFDLLIAATALAHKFVLVTNNVKHFNRINRLKLA